MPSSMHDCEENSRRARPPRSGTGRAGAAWVSVRESTSRTMKYPISIVLVASLVVELLLVGDASAQGGYTGDDSNEAPLLTATVRWEFVESATSVAGHTTVQLVGRFDVVPEVEDIYAIFGEGDDPLVIPPAWQLAAPFGANVGPVNPAFFAFEPNCPYDSWITLGVDGPALDPAALTSIGVDFTPWSETRGVSCDDGAVFFFHPEHGAQGATTLMQLTVVPTAIFSGSFNLQGRRSGGGDWELRRVVFSCTGSSRCSATTPPPPPPPPIRLRLRLCRRHHRHRHPLHWAAQTAAYRFGGEMNCPRSTG